MIGLVTGVTFFITLLFCGIQFYGIIVILISLLLLNNWGLELIKQVLNNKFESFKFHLLILGLAGLIVGSIITTTEMLNIDIVDYVNKEVYIEKTYEVKKDIKKNTFILSYDKLEKIENNNMKDNKIIYKLTYNDEIRYLENIEIENSLDRMYIKPDFKYKNIKPSYIKKVANIIIDDLKDNKLYNYSKIIDYKIEITANKKTLKLLKKLTCTFVYIFFTNFSN